MPRPLDEVADRRPRCSARIGEVNVGLILSGDAEAGERPIARSRLLLRTRRSSTSPSGGRHSCIGKSAPVRDCEADGPGLRNRVEGARVPAGTRRPTRGSFRPNSAVRLPLTAPPARRSHCRRAIVPTAASRRCLCHGRERPRRPTLTIASTIHGIRTGRSPPTASRRPSSGPR